MRVYEALAAAIVAEGIEVVFGLLAGDNDSLIYELVERHGVRFIAARHEHAAVGMAEGYSRVSGRIGVAIVTLGPGLTNAATALTAARSAGSSVLVIAGDKYRGGRHGWHDMDQPPFLISTAGVLQALSSPARVNAEIALAFRHVRLHDNPIVFTVPADEWKSLLPPTAEGPYASSIASLPTAQVLQPDSRQVAALAELLSSAKRPVILAGYGAVKARARESLISLAERVGGVLTTSLLAKDWFRGHPFNLGICGGFAHPGARSVLSAADLVVAFGASLTAYTLDHGRLFTQAKLVHVDTNPAAIGDISAVHRCVVGDARTTAEALLVRLETPRHARWATSELAVRIASIDPWEDAAPIARAGFASRHRVAQLSDELLPQERLLIAGVGHYQGLPATHVRISDPRDMMLTWPFGSVGRGIAAALGAAVAHPDRPVVLFEGDGGIMMGLADLETGARYGMRLLVICHDDNGFTADRVVLVRNHRDTALGDYRNPDLAALARCLGYTAYTATSDGEFQDILYRVSRIDGPTFINVKIHPEDWDARFNYALFP